MNTAHRIPSPDDTQFKLFGDRPPATTTPQLQTAINSDHRFITGDSHAIFLGTTRLQDYLQQSDQLTPLTVARLLDEQGWQTFEQRYAATGRAPYAPRLMMGLILYGVMQGILSLRELERLARLDLGCMTFLNRLRVRY